MKYTIEDLRNGKCAVINDGTLEELREVLRMAFPEDDCKVYPNNYFFMKHQYIEKLWMSHMSTILPTQSVKDFLKTKENFLDINHTPTFATPSLSDKIEELKEFAKSQGMECEVVVKEKKRVEVEGIHSGGSNTPEDKLLWKYSFVFKLNGYDTSEHSAEEMHHEILPFLAKQLERYLNNEL